MRFVLLFTVLCLLITSCISTRIPATTKIDSSKMVLDLQKGIDSIYVGYTTFKEIESILGKGERSRIRHKVRTVENWFLPNFEYLLSYPEAGIVFKTDANPRHVLKRKMEVIVLTSKFKGKTKEGLGIGSTYAEINEALSEDCDLSIVNGSYTECSFGFSKYFFTFRCNEVRDSISFVIEEIEIR